MFWTKGQRPCAGTQIILVGKSSNQFGIREQRSHRCGRRRPSGLGGTWNWFEVSTLPPKNSNTRTQPFTTPTLTSTEKNQTMSGWRERNSTSVLVTMCGHVWRVRRIRRRPKSRHVERLLTWEGTRGQILCQVVIGGRFLPDERKRSIIMDRQNWFNGLAKDASKP